MIPESFNSPPNWDQTESAAKLPQGPLLGKVTHPVCVALLNERERERERERESELERERDRESEREI